MKERPILFNGEMVRAILDGRKTQTRRAVKPQGAVLTDDMARSMGVRPPEDQNMPVVKCPFGQPGDRLWVRENWWQAGRWQVPAWPDADGDDAVWCGSKRIVYAADGVPPNEPNRHYPAGLSNGKYAAAEPNTVWRSRPSIHMPRWASRITLEITGVRVERLQDISDEDCWAEAPPWLSFPVRSPSDYACIENGPRKAFQRLWESINGAGSWGANPWVWVVEFKKLDTESVA